MNKIQKSEEEFMLLALELAAKAAAMGETPVGAVVVQDGKIIGRGHNRVEAEKDPTAHGEIVALREAARFSGDWRLPRATVYVTLEPCIMCAAALVHARVKRLVFGARDDRWGGVGSLFDLSHDPRINHELEVISGVMEKEAAELLRRFYRGCAGFIGCNESADSGEMPERPKGVDSKSTVSLWHRGFESLSLRHFMKKFVNLSFYTLANLFLRTITGGDICETYPYPALPMAIRIPRWGR